MSDLSSGKTEEEIKSAYARHFNIKYDTKDHVDLYTTSVLFEFKHDKNLASLKVRSAILAQTLYYLHKLKYGFTEKPIPQCVCIADKNEAFITDTKKWRKYYTDKHEKYDWDLAPSNPDINLVNDIAKVDELRNLHVFKIHDENEYKIFFGKLSALLQEQLSLGLSDKKLITEDNFEEVYEYWNRIFGDSVRNGLKTSKYFVCDIQEGRTIYFKEHSKVFFDFGAGEGRTKKILAKDYEYFWDVYEKVKDERIIRGILAKIDRLSDDKLRRFYGEFFTPVRFAKKGLEYIEKVVGKSWWEKGNYRLWDMAAGTGNLEYYLPNEALQFCYLSTIYKEDVEHCQRLFPEANVFQYDYLNDDIGNIFIEGALPFGLTWKLPQQLIDDLNNSSLKWIILINPPFATSQMAGTAGAAGGSKRDVSDTKVRKVMHNNDLGEVSRELFSQFLFRIKYEFEKRKAHLGLFAKLKYINSTNDQKFRDSVFRFGFEKGFMFSSVNFAGTSRNAQFPVGFLVWDLNKTKALENQEILIDVFNENVEKIAQKNVRIEKREIFLSKWINRKPARIKYPPFGSAINIKRDNLDSRDRISENFIGSLMCCGNDLQHQKFTSILSGPYVSAGAHSITPDIFEKSMIVHSVRRIPKTNWINDRDQYMQPNKTLSSDFINDCVMWSIFSYSNETVSMRDVEYMGNLYQIKNHFFPFKISELKKWEIADADIKSSMYRDEDRYVANWISKNKISKESETIYEIGKNIYQVFYKELNVLNTTKFKIQIWDAGWWQIRNALKDQNMAQELFIRLKEAHDSLKEKLLPKIYEYGFLN
ncbi:MAG: hypothetical protein PHN88_00400 [Ignavibacteria bacterium]|nr:hypothetical protein [Ignavibacteria bacterium]